MREGIHARKPPNGLARKSPVMSPSSRNLTNYPYASVKAYNNYVQEQPLAAPSSTGTKRKGAVKANNN